MVTNCTARPVQHQHISQGWIELSPGDLLLVLLSPTYPPAPENAVFLLRVAGGRGVTNPYQSSCSGSRKSFLDKVYSQGNSGLCARKFMFESGNIGLVSGGILRPLHERNFSRQRGRGSSCVDDVSALRERDGNEIQWSRKNGVSGT